MGRMRMLPDDTCWFVAADFDGEEWTRDGLPYVETSRLLNIPFPWSDLVDPANGASGILALQQFGISF